MLLFIMLLLGFFVFFALVVCLFVCLLVFFYMDLESVNKSIYLSILSCFHLIHISILCFCCVLSLYSTLVN